MRNEAKGDAWFRNDPHGIIVRTVIRNRLLNDSSLPVLKERERERERGRGLSLRVVRNCHRTRIIIGIHADNGAR